MRDDQNLRRRFPRLPYPRKTIARDTRVSKRRFVSRRSERHSKNLRLRRFRRFDVSATRSACARASRKRKRLVEPVNGTHTSRLSSAPTSRSRFVRRFSLAADPKRGSAFGDAEGTDADAPFGSAAPSDFLMESVMKPSAPLSLGAASEPPRSVSRRTASAARNSADALREYIPRSCELARRR